MLQAYIGGTGDRHGINAWKRKGYAQAMEVGKGIYTDSTFPLHLQALGVYCKAMILFAR
jgi:hypothetical protein